jgi:hypothetical protein
VDGANGEKLMACADAKESMACTNAGGIPSRIKLICCDVFLRPVSAFVAASPHIIDVEFVPMLAHNEPDILRADLQRRIDAAAALQKYDLFLLSYGLCGNTAVGLSCPVRLVMPRVHDCCALFMGSREKFLAAFGGQLSKRWCTAGYFERGYAGNSREVFAPHSRFASGEYQALVEKYGTENANYVWETLHPPMEMDTAAYIRTPGFEVPGCEEAFIRIIEGQNKRVDILEGDTKYLHDLINGPWDDERFLTVEPGHAIVGVYDMERVVAANLVRFALN